jgi:hypothetical protein
MVAPAALIWPSVGVGISGVQNSRVPRRGFGAFGGNGETSARSTFQVLPRMSVLRALAKAASWAILVYSVSCFTAAFGLPTATSPITTRDSWRLVNVRGVAFDGYRSKARQAWDLTSLTEFG